MFVFQGTVEPQDWIEDTGSSYSALISVMPAKYMKVSGKAGRHCDKENKKSFQKFEKGVKKNSTPILRLVVTGNSWKNPPPNPKGDSGLHMHLSLE